MDKRAMRILFLIASVLVLTLCLGVVGSFGNAQTASITLDVNLLQQQGLALPDSEELPPTDGIEVEIIPHVREMDAVLSILIYHTHTYEAYEPDPASPYKATERWRTADSSYNILRVGNMLQDALIQMGCRVEHNTTNFELPPLSASYQRSLAMLEESITRGEHYDLYIDVHRDAFAAGLYAGNTVVVEGLPMARVMFLVGQGTGTANGQGFAQKPDWEANLARAEMITRAINGIAPLVARPVSVKTGRYNQHISTGALLLEIGNNKNSLEEALNAIPVLARAVVETGGGTHLPPYMDTQSKSTTTP